MPKTHESARFIISFDSNMVDDRCYIGGHDLLSVGESYKRLRKRQLDDTDVTRISNIKVSFDKTRSNVA